MGSHKSFEGASLDDLDEFLLERSGHRLGQRATRLENDIGEDDVPTDGVEEGDSSPD